MKLKTLAVATVVAVAGAAAHADVAKSTTATLVLNPGKSVSYSNGYGGTGVSFTDYLNLSLPVGSWTASIASSSFAVPDFSGLSSLSMSLEKEVGGTWQTIAVGSGSLGDGMSLNYTGLSSGSIYRLLMSGVTASTGVFGGGYSVAATVAAVPEPASVALFLAGIGALGLVGRRRKMAEKDHADAALA